MQTNCLVCSVARVAERLRPIAAVLQWIMLLALRLIYGGQFIQTGYGKLMNLDKVTRFFTTLNLPAPHFMAGLVACTEFFGGILLVLGLGTRPAAFALTINMTVAYLTADREAFKSLDAFTSATPYQFFLACLLLLAFGPGWASLDAIIAAIARKKSTVRSADSQVV